MPRHPAIQCDERVKELTSRLRYYSGVLRGDLVAEEVAREALNKQTLKVANTRARYQKIQEMLDRLSVASALWWPWGLPVNVKIAEYEEIVPNSSGCFAFSEADRQAESKHRDGNEHS